MNFNQIVSLKVPENEEKIPDSLPAVTSISHIRGENPTSQMVIKPSPSNIHDKLAWSRASERAASHPRYRPQQFRNCLSYRTPFGSNIH